MEVIAEDGAVLDPAGLVEIHEVVKKGAEGRGMKYDQTGHVDRRRSFQKVCTAYRRKSNGPKLALAGFL